MKRARSRKQIIALDFFIPGIILLVLTTIFWMTELDLAIQRLFFVHGKGWIYNHTQPWEFLHDYGPLPAILLTIASLLVLIGSFRFYKIVPYRRMLAFIILLMLIGPGFVVNMIFKQHWGRPRPRNITVFGGKQQFLYVWEKGEKGNSFPSGHASMGFFLFAPYFILRKISKKWSYSSLLLGLSSGFIIGMARIIKGGHFASDVLWAGGFVYLCGLSLYYLLRLDQFVWHNDKS